MSSSQESHRKRKQAKRRFLRRYHQTWISKCHWCGQPIVWTTQVPPSKIVKVHRSDYVTVLLFDKPVRLFVGTIDHVVPLRDNGANDLSNLVGSCRPCNLRRTRTPKPEGPKLCIDCGGVKNGPARRRCRKCAERRASEYFKELPIDHPTFQHLRENNSGHPHSYVAKVLRKIGRADAARFIRGLDVESQQATHSPEATAYKDANTHREADRETLSSRRSDRTGSF